MNKRLTSFLYQKAIAAVLFALLIIVYSCRKDEKGSRSSPEPTPGRQVQFTSSVEGETGTKATGNTWEANDNIGVFMKKASDASVLAANKKYTTTTGNGNFTAQTSDAFSYPGDGSAVNFVAYYPYKSTITGNIYKVDVSSQSNLPAIDLMYANNSTGFSQASTTLPNLNFAHQLARVNLIVQAGGGIANLNGITASFQDFNTQADFDLNTGTFAAGTNPANISAKISGTAAAERVASAVLIPITGATNKKVVITLPSGESFTWLLPNGTNLEKGKNYNYTVILQKSIPVSILNIDYETGTLNSGITGISSSHATAADANYMVQPGATGNYAIAHKVVYGDNAYYSDGAYRSESDAIALTAARYAPGDERRYEFSVLLKDWTPWLSDPIYETNIFQLKVSGNSTTDSGVPLQLRASRNALRLRYRDNIRVVNFLSDLRPYVNQWIHFRIDAKWTKDATGYIRTFMKLPGQNDFKLVDEKTNYDTFAGDPAVGNIGYIKWGVYGIQEGLTRITYHDDIRIYKLN